jgi:hypothetical protein
MTPKSQHPPVVMLSVVGLVVAAAGIMVQYVSGVDFPTIPLGPIILLAAAAVVVVQVVGLAIALPAGIVAAKRSSRRAGVAGRPRGAQ